MLLMDLLSRRWALRLLWELRDGPQTYGVLQVRCGHISPTILSRRLNDLKAAGILAAHAQGYGLTTLGAELGPKLLDLSNWAAHWVRCQAG